MSTYSAKLRLLKDYYVGENGKLVHADRRLTFASKKLALAYCEHANIPTNLVKIVTGDNTHV